MYCKMAGKGELAAVRGVLHCRTTWLWLVLSLVSVYLMVRRSSTDLMATVAQALLQSLL